MANFRTNLEGSQKLVDRYVKALVRGDEALSGEVIQAALAAGFTIVQIYSNILTPAHVDIDQLSADRVVNKAHHHLATQITLSHMEQLRSRQRVSQNGRRVIVAVVERGEHFLRALMMSDVFRSDGWMVDYLGGFVPLKDLLQLLQERAPELLAIPITPRITTQTIKRIVKAVQGLEQPPAILLEGVAFEPGSGQPLAGTGVRVAANLDEALNIARESLSGCGRAGGLERFLKSLGGRIRTVRRGLSLTQQQLAGKANLDRTYIVAVERGRQNVTVGAVMRIAEALNVSIDHLLVSER